MDGEGRSWLQLLTICCLCGNFQNVTANLVDIEGHVVVAVISLVDKHGVTGTGIEHILVVMLNSGREKDMLVTAAVNFVATFKIWQLPIGWVNLYIYIIHM